MRTTLNERQQVVLECIYRQLSNQKALEYLKEQGFPISETTYKRDKHIIKSNSLQRLYQLAKVDFRALHQDRLEKIKTIESLMWKDVEDCRDPFRKAKIKEMIANLQPILTAYEDTIQYVLQKSPTKSEQNQTISV